MSEPKRTVVGYIQDNVGWGFNLVVSNILFWLTGFPTVRDYGYSSENYDENGGIPSGGEGSGVFVITLVLMVICYIVYFGRMVTFLTSKDSHKLE
ncbi:unnamed protein product [Aphanomyces euteiches]|uniref:Uncharacterized protein n=1 Tax=Aphanomyces euteiches TaxID=100861 RepID=A0A6G0XHM4_9STRA|nr:hypothetical protein Ae201684_004654 [Aphanomyces euteiches]KAH9073195.1 hypothetical protein Ae201684P_015012 [Aphanomyces euteiches]KAH9091333.1 hypothetical protein LEN26_018745 [Aphanomyces euteiches]KAH9129266.1 hypothetical protein AeMF1_000689 [Aphanomyces euteiches]KAH9139350.1 hypothetical protein AeRB84_016373 [Aphanomyces euteiches]